MHPYEFGCREPRNPTASTIQFGTPILTWFHSAMVSQGDTLQVARSASHSRVEFRNACRQQGLVHRRAAPKSGTYMAFPFACLAHNSQTSYWQLHWSGILTQSTKTLHTFQSIPAGSSSKPKRNTYACKSQPPLKNDVQSELKHTSSAQDCKHNPPKPSPKPQTRQSQCVAKLAAQKHP